ncbi:hypothetical protein LPJ75_004838, partial [Coemansia sp. RSA 2598]
TVAPTIPSRLSPVYPGRMYTVNSTCSADATAANQTALHESLPRSHMHCKNRQRKHMRPWSETKKLVYHPGVNGTQGYWGPEGMYPYDNVLMRFGDSNQYQSYGTMFINDTVVNGLHPYLFVGNGTMIDGWMVVGNDTAALNKVVNGTAVRGNSFRAAAAANPAAASRAAASAAALAVITAAVRASNNAAARRAAAKAEEARAEARAEAKEEAVKAVKAEEAKEVKVMEERATEEAKETAAKETTTKAMATMPTMEARASLVQGTTKDSLIRHLHRNRPVLQSNRRILLRLSSGKRLSFVPLLLLLCQFSKFQRRALWSRLWELHQMDVPQLQLQLRQLMRLLPSLALRGCRSTISKAFPFTVHRAAAIRPPSPMFRRTPTSRPSLDFRPPQRFLYTPSPAVFSQALLQSRVQLRLV